jgi:hypothetical protein
LKELEKGLKNASLHCSSELQNHIVAAVDTKAAGDSFDHVHTSEVVTATSKEA